MKELLSRLAANRRISLFLVLATVFATVLALASSLYTIQVLNRYVSHGVDATLLALTVGVILAIGLEWGFRHARLRLAKTMMMDADYHLGLGVFGLLSTARVEALQSIPAGERRELLRAVEQVESAFNPSSLTAMIDVPFSLLFIIVLALISVPLGLVALLFVAIVIGLGLLGQSRLKGDVASLMSESMRANMLASSVCLDTDTVRVFSAQGFLIEQWGRSLAKLQSLRRRVSFKQGQVQSLGQSAQGLMGVMVIALGAILVVRGELSVGALIGCNILAARALAPIQRFAQLGEAIDRARQAKARIGQFAQIPTEPEQGAALEPFEGCLQLHDVSYSLAGATSPLFESVNLTLQPGEVLAVVGDSGSGKTTLARMIAGLLQPTRGQLLADGVDIQQLSPAWWRSQLMVMPQEPRFVAGSLRDNLTLSIPEATDDEIRACLQRAGAQALVDASADGLQRELLQAGHEYSVGERRLLSLARALLGGGRIAIFDEPTAGLDKTGVQRVYSVLIDLAKRGHTLVCCSHDENIISGATWILDLNEKPVPALRRTTAVAPKARKHEQTSA